MKILREFEAALRGFLLQAGYVIFRNRRSRELADEMAFHREMAARDAGQSGEPSEIRRSFGNELRLREQAREAWGWTWIDRLVQDVAYALRTLRRSRGFTITAVLVLAVGIGVNVTAFSLFNMMVLQSLPIRDPGSIVRLERRSPDASTNVMPYPSMAFYCDHARTLSAVMGTIGVDLELEKDVQPVNASFVTANYFAELGTQPMLGRLLDPVRDGAVNAAPVVVLSYGFWERRFGADPNIVGRTIHVNHQAATVAGVLSSRVALLGGARPDMWLPIVQTPYFVAGSTALVDADGGAVEMWGRLAPGVSAGVAAQELVALTNQLRRLHPAEIWMGEYIRVAPGGHDQVMQGDTIRTMAMVGAFVLLILAVACANLGGLLLARGVSREHEIGIRVAIGAGRSRIFRQLFTESVVLAMMGSACGLGLGYVALRLTMAHANAPTWMSAAPDWRVLLFGIAIGLVAAVIFGFAPALQIARQRQRKTIVRQLLLGAQVAASCVLLILAGLLVRALERAIYTNPGFGYEQVVAIDPGLNSHGYKPANARSYVEQFETRLRALPGVTSVGLTSMPPLGHNRISTISNTINGHLVRIFPFSVDAEFFRTMEIPILHGRNFLPGEQHAVIVSETLARKQWPGEDPVGKTDASGSSAGDVVVGVAGKARLVDMQDGDAVELYHAAREENMPDTIVLVKTMGAPDGLPPTIHAIAVALDPKLFPDVRLLKGEFLNETQGAKSLAAVVGLLGMVAVLLSALGIVGLVAYTVSQRSKEIAIRIALGANAVEVLASVLRQFSWPVVCGLVAGVSLTAALSQVLRRVLYGVSHLDPLSYVAGIGMLIAIIAVAALLPARRALRLDVARALHEQ